ncbi:T9SS type A sorting domain-containing protein [uncultured Lacinutrix sp.]|uniref:T9SS type A sorting domain-containing protein n=1 Tax=uncultured Lacinutrix sp. TaxID=574032 RepID=UPI00261335F3|nr:T9SS type A sorting domain-containing protein [uncultured Lacinutrix sp.]
MLKTITFLFLQLLITNIYAQTVSTIIEGSFSDGLAIDSQGNIYGSDWNGNTVYKYDTTGNVSIFKNGFSNPNGIAANSLDEIYICDHTANSIYKYDTNANLLASYTAGLITPAGIKRIPNTEDFIIVEYGTFTSSSKIKKLESNGTITTLYDGAPLNGPAGIAFINNIPYIANFNDRKIFKFENNTLTLIAQLSANGPSNSNFLGFLSTIGNQLIATQIGENKIYTINPNNGTITLYAGSIIGDSDGNINDATFSAPNGILGDDINNKIYISDATTKNLRIIDNAFLSVDEFENTISNIKLFPNPTADSLHIKIDTLKEKKVSISIIDINGKEVFNKNFYTENSTFNTKINTKNYPSGLYTVLITSNKQRVSKKILF